MVFLFLLFLFISLFVLFITSRHDFVLIRQNISIRQIFDKAFIIIFLSLILSRIFYLVDNNLYDFFLDPLRFLHIVLYWGFNFLGLFIGVAVGVAILFRKRKNILRILDIYLLSFYPILFFEAISLMILGELSLLIFAIYIFLLIIMFGVFLKMHTGFGIRDGVVAFAILILSALSYLAYSFLREGAIVLNSPIQIIATIVVGISIYCLVLIRINFFNKK